MERVVGVGVESMVFGGAMLQSVVIIHVRFNYRKVIEDSETSSHLSLMGGTLTGSRPGVTSHTKTSNDPSTRQLSSQI